MKNLNQKILIINNNLLKKQKSNRENHEYLEQYIVQ